MPEEPVYLLRWELVTTARLHDALPTEIRRLTYLPGGGKTLLGRFLPLRLFRWTFLSGRPSLLDRQCVSRVIHGAPGPPHDCDDTRHCPAREE
jgi:hypothetical protein